MKSSPTTEPVLLTSFASHGFFRRQRLLHDSAIRLGVVTQSRIVRQSELLASDYGKANRELLAHPRGAGYWAWKPHLILEGLDRVSPSGWVLYSDVGRWPRVLGHSLDPLFRWCADHDQPFVPGTRIKDLGSALPWTKRHCAEFFGHDQESLGQFQQTSATWSLWNNCDRSREFLEKWRQLALHPGLIDDCASSQPEWPGFIVHRHDQSLLSCLVQNYGLHVLQDEAMPVDHDKCKNLDRVLKTLGAPAAGNLLTKAAFASIQAVWSLEPWVRNNLRNILRRNRGIKVKKVKLLTPPI